MPRKRENPSEFVIELVRWTLGYSFWVNDKRERGRWGPYFDVVRIKLHGLIIVPAAKRYALAQISMFCHDAYGLPIETSDPHPIIGHVEYKRPVLKGSFCVPQRMIAVLVQAINCRATRYVYLNGDALKRNKAHMYGVSFEPEIDVEDYSDPTRERPG